MVWISMDFDTVVDSADDFVNKFLSVGCIVYALYVDDDICGVSGSGAAFQDQLSKTGGLENVVEVGVDSVDMVDMVVIGAIVASDGFINVVLLVDN